MEFDKNTSFPSNSSMTAFQNDSKRFYHAIIPDDKDFYFNVYKC
jgi:hypothetical protein